MLIWVFRMIMLELLGGNNPYREGLIVDTPDFSVIKAKFEAMIEDPNLLHGETTPEGMLLSIAVGCKI